MKSNNALNKQGYLLPEYYQVWADYYVKFMAEDLSQMVEENVEFNKLKLWKTIS